MLSAGAWKRNQANTILFVMVDANGLEVAGLGSTFTLQISKAGAAFAASSGTKSEVALGWYRYISTAAEADTVGPVAIVVTGAGTIQQNLEYVVEQRTTSAIAFTYTVTDIITSLPIEGVLVSFSTDVLGANVVWAGYTDAFGVARDSSGNLPYLDPGTYTIKLQKAGYTFSDDTETVS